MLKIIHSKVMTNSSKTDICDCYDGPENMSLTGDDITLDCRVFCQENWPNKKTKLHKMITLHILL